MPELRGTLSHYRNAAHQLSAQAREELKNEAVEQQKALAEREKALKEKEAELL